MSSANGRGLKRCKRRSEVIRVTFEGKTYHDIAVSMTEYLYESRGLETAEKPAAAKLEELKPKPEPEKKQDAKPDAKERMAKARAAKGKKKTPEPAAQYDKEIHPVVEHEPTPVQPSLEDVVLEAVEPEPIDPVNLAALRVKTTEDLQAAYSSGKHKQVLALLSKFGNGAKSFRELQINDFVPIRKAIDDGALA
jgi:hypothetical protein